MIFPDDDNGGALRRMAAQGDDLTKPRNIDFAVTFPDAYAAQQFAQHLRALDEVVFLHKTEADSDLPWDVIVVKNMVPTHRAITDFEDGLQLLADRWGGRNDGWGCFSEAIKH